MLHDATTINAVTWPSHDLPIRPGEYLRPLIHEGPPPYVTNVAGRMSALQVGAHVLPVVVPERGRRPSYVTSPYSHYIRYAREELNKRDDRLRRPAIRVVLAAAGMVCRVSRFDHVVYVNNWLISTNPAPALTSGEAAAAIEELRDTFPNRAIVFRSVNPTLDPSYADALCAAGCALVPSRQVYLLDCASRTSMRNDNVRRDLRLLARSGYEVVAAASLRPDDVPRLTALYRGLYLEKHSSLNQQFTERYFSLLLVEGLMNVRALRKDGRIDAFAASYRRPGLTTGAIIGYDIRFPQIAGLYRQTIALLIQEAQSRGDLLNLSGGSRSFKVLRGAVPCVEYDAVYLDHLPRRRRLGWCVAAQAGRFLDASARRKRAPAAQARVAVAATR